MPEHPGMSLDPLLKRLREDGRYETAPRAVRTAADRLLGRFDAWFHLGLIRIVCRAGIQARRGLFGRDQFVARSLDILRLVESCGGRVVVSGGDIPFGLDGPAVYVSNHMGTLETMLLPSLLAPAREFVTVVKEDLLDYPAFGRVLRALGAIGVGRRDPREDLRRVLEQGETALRAGRSVLVFPQATRDAVFRRREFNSLAVKLARRTGAPVAPVAVKTDFLGIGRVLRDFGPLHRGRPVMLRIGAPLAVTSGGREAHEKAVEFIAATLREWGAPVE